jgi:hypothetical protein
MKIAIVAYVSLVLNSGVAFGEEIQTILNQSDESVTPALEASIEAKDLTSDEADLEQSKDFLQHLKDLGIEPVQKEFVERTQCEGS